MNALIAPLFFIFFFVVFLLIVDSRTGNLRRFIDKLKSGPKSEFLEKVAAGTKLVSGIYAAGLFVMVAVINICTWYSDDVGRYIHSLMFLHLFVLLAFFLCFGFLKLGRSPADKGKSLPELPKWARTVMAALFIYYFASFVPDLIQFHGGYSIREQDGKHFFKSGNGPEHEMSPQEYLQEETKDLRQFSAIWMVFSFNAAVYLLLTKERPKQGVAPVV